MSDEKEAAQLRATIDGMIAHQANGVIEESSPEVFHRPEHAPQSEPMQFVVLHTESARAFIREEIEKALHPGMPDPRVYLHVEVRDMDGHQYGGMLYLREPVE